VSVVVFPAFLDRLMKILGILFFTMLALCADEFPKVYNSERNQKGEPISPEAAAKSFQVPEGFEVTVFAAEPELRNPIAMAWGVKKRMWVAENYTYAEKEKRFDLNLRDRIVIFEDEDRDGKAEKRKIFTDKLQMLTSIEVQPGGVWAMCPPQLLFIPDRDGDDIPDSEPEVILDGFTVAKSNYHNFANGLRWGPDGWLYGRCGGSCPGNVGVPGTLDDKRIPLRGGIWRYHPKRKFFEVIVHGTTNPWGHDWDQHGEGFFINTVNGHLWHMIPGGHFDRPFGRSVNPLVYEAIQMHADHWHFDKTGSWTKSRNGAANEFGGGHAHIGMCIYQGDHLPEEWRGKLLTWNQHGRRLNRERLERQGSGYVARHEPDQFLAGDEWFRGLDIREGPDGALYGLDWSDTGECHDHTGVHRTSGRIYRFSHGEIKEVPIESSFRDQKFNYNGIASPWGRRQVRKILSLDGPGNRLRRFPIDFGDGGDPLNELRMLWMAHSVGPIEKEVLMNILEKEDEHLRVWAIRLLTDEWAIDSVYGPMESRKVASDPELRDRFVKMAKEDQSGLVRLALASTLQRIAVEDRVVLASALAGRVEDALDHNLPKLVWFGLMHLGEEKLEVAKVTKWRELLRYLARSSSGEPAIVEKVVAISAANEAMTEALLQGLVDGFKGVQKAPIPRGWGEVSPILAKRVPRLTRELSALFGDGRAMDSLKIIALDEKKAIAVRKRALAALIDAKVKDLRPLCEQLFWVKGLCETAVKGLAQFENDEVGRNLVKSFSKLLLAEEKAAVINVLVTRQKWARFLLAELKAGKIPRRSVTPFHARQILAMKDDALSKMLQEIWGKVRESDENLKKKIIVLEEALTPDVRARGDKAQGRVLFQTLCASCHQLYGKGGKLGPDLTGSGRADLGYLLENIIAPNSVVPVEYQMSLITLKDGRVMSGLITASDERMVTLKTLADEISIEKKSIFKNIRVQDSMMPPGLLSALTAEQIRDLIAYLMHPQQVALPKSKK
jgi:putative membrane-bound dehydrogenase-like protein